MRAAIVDTDGRLLDRVAARTPLSAARPDGLVDLVTDLLRQHSVVGGVIGVPGRVNYGKGRLEYAPNLPPSWVPFLTEGWLSEVLGAHVMLANDADMAAVGEALFGAGRDFEDVAYITISTGVGAGVVLGGRLMHGSRSLAEIGHTVIDRSALSRGRPATVEELASGGAMGGRAAQLGLVASGADLVALRDLDRRARAIWADAVEVAGLAVANLVHLFSPDVVVVGGGVGRSGEVLLAPVRKLLAAHGPIGLHGVRVVPAALGDDAGLIGAAQWCGARGGGQRTGAR